MSEEKLISKPTANPAYTLHPTLKDKKSRQKHVVEALLAYNSGIIDNNPAGANAKFEKLKLSPFVFLRGTADLMYRDLAGTDADMANVLLMGDVHLENFGVMETEDGSLIWGLNDFDEAEFGPFSWDVKRAATSTVLAAVDRGFKKADRAKLAKIFAAAYLAAIEKAEGSGRESKSQFTKNRGPAIIRKLIRKTEKTDVKQWLAEYVDEGDRFIPTDEIQPLTKRTSGFQKEIDAYLASLAHYTENPPEKLTVLDVATKTGSGTGSVGLWRFYALTEATRGNRTERLILEIKRERPSVLAPYVPPGPFQFQSEGSRVAFAQETHLPNANPYYGYLSIDDMSYLVRERSPFKARVKLEKLTDLKDFREYVEACGAALAYSHARTDLAIAKRDHSSEAKILQSVNPKTFAVDVERFAMAMADRVSTDWKTFVKAHKAGKFTFEVPCESVPTT